VCVAAACLTLAARVAPVAAQRAPADDAAQARLAGVLQAAGAYVDVFKSQFFGVVAEERYQQLVRGQSIVAAANMSRQRDFLSEVAMLEMPNIGWVGFRDVVEVDGRTVVDRADRLTRLLQSTSDDLLKQGRALADEGSRFNLGSVTRNLNHPSLALAFLGRDRQVRSTFTLDGDGRIGGEAMTVVRFVEHARPTTVRGGATGRDVYASGRFWIAPATGVIGRSELQLRIDRTTATLTATYGPNAKFRVWVPASLRETYDTGSTEVIEGVATYRNYRTFGVDTNTVIK